MGNCISAGDYIRFKLQREQIEDVAVPAETFQVPREPICKTVITQQPTATKPLPLNTPTKRSSIRNRSR